MTFEYMFPDYFTFFYGDLSLNNQTGYQYFIFMIQQRRKCQIEHRNEILLEMYDILRELTMM